MMTRAASMSKMSRSMLESMDRFVLERLAGLEPRSRNGHAPREESNGRAAQYATAGANYN